MGLPWLAQMRRRHGWSAVAFILCHEIGHTVDFTPVAGQWTRELYADEIAGMLLAALGLPLDGAVHFLAAEANCLPCTSPPPAAARIVAVARGYRQMLAQTMLS
ncbi:MAG TPA: hypothetical protein VFG23_12910 [Polyangia bacterium]|nr:hypothetical protein [Polyangia bacterium]